MWLANHPTIKGVGISFFFFSKKKKEKENKSIFLENVVYFIF
jgi:hypothetical protein